MQNIQMLAGFASSLIFVSSNLPMLFKAIQTRNLKSYSPIHLVLSNLGNLIYWLYVVSLPLGPIWFLHSFFTLTTLIMLVLYLRFEGGAGLFGGRLSLKVSKK